MMELLKEIDAGAKVNDFKIFLEDLKSLDPVVNELVTECIAAKIEVLREMGRGDFDAHLGMARNAGYEPEVDPKVQQRLQSKTKLGLRDNEPTGAPEAGQLVKYQGKVYVLDDTDGKIAFLKDPKAQTPFGGNSTKIIVNDLKPIKTKSGKTAWIHVGH